MPQYDIHQFGQKDFLPAHALERPLHLIGAGGIGSPTAMVLEKMGFLDLTVWDPDAIEPHNVGSQLYHADQEEQIKVVALHRFVEQFQEKIALFPAPDLELAPLSIVVSAVDSMQARKTIWQYLKNQRFLSFYVDARMGLESIRLYGVDPLNAQSVSFYEQNLYDDTEADALPCSAKAVAYNGFFAAAAIGGIISAFLRGAPLPTELIGDMARFDLTQTV